MIPDPELLRKLSWLSSLQPRLHATRGATDSPPGCTSGAPSSLELEYIVDFFLALTLCNSVVVSSPVQPQHSVSTCSTLTD